MLRRDLFSHTSEAEKDSELRTWCVYRRATVSTRPSQPVKEPEPFQHRLSFSEADYEHALSAQTLERP